MNGIASARRLPTSLSGIDAAKALRLASQLGCVVTDVRRTGEKRVVHPALPGSVTLHGSRRDAGRKLTTFLRKALRLASGSSGSGHPPTGTAGSLDPDRPVDPDRAARLMAGFRERFNCSLYELLAAAGLSSWPVMRLHRLVTGERPWSSGTLAPFVPVVARRRTECLQVEAPGQALRGWLCLADFKRQVKVATATAAAAVGADVTPAQPIPHAD